MNSRIASNERSNFADRLQSALIAAKEPTGATAFARAYNLRAKGASVTAHAGRKWLKGEAIPTHEKIQIMAKWLNVHASWLRFGDAQNGAYRTVSNGTETFSTNDLVLINDIVALPEFAQAVVRDLVDSLLRISVADRGESGVQYRPKSAKQRSS